MFDIECLFLRDFKSYAGEHTITFPTEAGLYFLTGINSKEPRLESNGAGKSTLLDAIYWCLYGKTLRGLKAGDVITWGETSCEVNVTLNIAGTITEVWRTQNPNVITVDGTIVDQDTLTKRLGLTAEAFIYSVMMPQYNQSFFELTPANKLTLFSQILGLETWLEWSQRATKTVSDLTINIAAQTKHIDAFAITIHNATAELSTLRGREEVFALDNKEVIKRIKERILRIKSEIEKLVKESDKADFSELEASLEVRNIERDKNKTAIFDQEEYVKDLHIAYIKQEAVVDGLIKGYQDLASLGASCPKCLQKISETHRRSERTKAATAVEQQEFFSTGAKEQWEVAEKALQKMIKGEKALTLEISNLEQDYKQAERANTQLKFEISKLKTELKANEDSVENETKRLNPFTALLAEKEALIAKHTVRHKSLTETVARLTAEHEATNFWATGFKRVRLFIIEETLRTLEVEVNNSLTQLGLVGWQVTFDVERENKAGGLTKGFVVLVTSPGHTEPVRWEAWSGGESQRLQLAGDLGLANLIMQQAGLRNTIEFYDEPSKHLSKAGLMDLAETLHQRAIDDGKRIFLVDHNMPEFGEFTGVITVTKDEQGSVIT